MGVNSSNNICVALNNLYSNLLGFIDNYEFNKIQKKYLENIKRNLEIALPMGKYVTSKLEEFKRKDDPTYNNQSDFFEKDKDYIEEMKLEAKKLKETYKNYEIKNINEKDFFKELNGYKKYELVKKYEEAYNLALLLDDTFENSAKRNFEQILKRILHCYYMSYRMCKKLEYYKTIYIFDGDNGKYWLKDQKMSSIKYHSLRFRKINEKRFERKKHVNN